MVVYTGCACLFEFVGCLGLRLFGVLLVICLLAGLLVCYIFADIVCFDLSCLVGV